MASIHRSKTPVMLLFSRLDLLLCDTTKRNQIISQPWNLFFAINSVYSVVGSISSRSHWVYEEVVFKMSEGLANRLHTEICTGTGRAKHEQLAGALPAVVKWEKSTFAGHSPNRLGYVAGKENGADACKSSSSSHPPAFIGLTTLH